MNLFSRRLLVLCVSVCCFGAIACGGKAALRPDFTLSATPSPIQITPGTTQTFSLTVTAENAFGGAVAVVASGLPSGVTISPSAINLTAGSTQSVSLVAASTAKAGTTNVTLTGTSGKLVHSASVSLTTTAPPQPRDVTTYHYNNSRDGLNDTEIFLTPSNVNSTQFGKIEFDSTDGKVDAEPLFVANIKVGGKPRNVLYVATEHGSVYAFDADSGAILWTTSTLGSGETPSDVRGCGSFDPEIGITATPVIDRKQGQNGTIFVVGMSKDGSGGYHQRLHGLDLSTGQEINGGPTEITGSFPGTGPNSQNGTTTFDPSQYAERVGLLLANGNIYLGWTSFCDHQPYNGWVMSYSEATLKQSQVLNLTPNGTGGAVWMSGAGMAADSTGNIYLVNGNGTFEESPDSNGFPSGSDFGNAVLRLSPNGKLTIADYFTPCNTIARSMADVDLGSGGGVLLPDLQDANGKTKSLIAAAGKDGGIYLVDRNNLGKFKEDCSDTSNVYQSVPEAVAGGIFSTPAFFNSQLYYAAAGDSLRAISMSDALIQVISSRSTTTFAFPGATPVVTASGTTNGIAWAVESNQSRPAVLHAYDASDLANELYNSGQAANGRDSFGDGNKFITPMVVNGKVYIGTPTGVAVFGLLSQ